MYYLYNGGCCAAHNVIYMMYLPTQALYLMPSSSARCAQFPRAQDKVHFYIKLRELRDSLKGIQRAAEIEEVDYSFDLGLAKGKLQNTTKQNGCCCVYKPQSPKQRQDTSILSL